MNEELKNEIHSGFNANGEETYQNDFEDKTLEKDDEIVEKSSSFAHSDCTKLYTNGVYEKPNIIITGGKVTVSLGRNVTKIQLRSVPGNGIRHFRGGTHRIPNGEYVLSLFGTTYPYSYIRACVSYS